MLSENIVFQSAGSFSVAVLALLMMILQAIFFFKKPQFTWYAWGAAMSFSALVYSVGIFLEYNTPEGSLNRVSGLLEFTAIICLIHCVYGFTFSYLGIESKRYHPVAGVCHGLILLLLWFTNYIVAESFITRDFIGLQSPYIEPAMGPLGPMFVIYAVVAGVTAMIIWIKRRETDPKYRVMYLAGIGFWFLLGIHDGLASLGFPAFQYFMEYGFFGFAIVVLWIVFKSYFDITERKRVEQELLESEEEYRTLVDNLPVAVYQNTPGPEGQFLMVNPAFCKMFGFKNEEEVKKFTAASLYQNPKERNDYSNRLIRKGVINNDERTLLKRDGTPIYASITSRVVYGKDGEISHFDTILVDITDEMLTKEALCESEEKYRSMMEAMNDPVYICSSDFLVAYMNASMIKMIGNDLTGEPCHKALFDKEEKCPWCIHDKVQQGESAETEIVNPKNNRSYTVIHSPIFHEDGSISKMTIFRDTTVAKHLEAQLFRSERLSATGQLAASIAHEINSPLQGITSLLYSIERSHGQDEKLLEKLNLVTRGFTGIRDIVKNLLDLNRPGNEKKQPMNINNVIENTVALLKNHLKTNNTKIVLNLSSKMPDITASPQQLGQVFMNLISNAVEAITGTSKSKDIFKTRENINGEITINSDLGKDTIIIDVADTGPGISEEDLEHIFDPFYTRKKEKGIGIGLSLCHGIIEDHNGSITAKNSPEGGSIFKITLPIR